MAAREEVTPDMQAADWLARLQRDDLPAEEREAFERWLNADPVHAVAFARTEFAWERASRLHALPASERGTSDKENVRSGAVHWWKAAAAVAAVAVVSAAWYAVAQQGVYTTALGERRTVSLDDGSQINLNTLSRIEVDFDAHTRIVHLNSGEALFKVAPDPRRPFIVEAGGTQVRAVGTAFNVRLRDTIVEVTVTEGTVAMNTDRISAGSAAVAAGSTINRVALTQDTLRRRVAWRDGAIELRGETLAQAVEEFNRYRKSKLVVADPAIENLRVGGRFETDEAEKFVNALNANFAIRSVPGEGGSIYLLGPERQ